MRALGHSEPATAPPGRIRAQSDLRASDLPAWKLRRAACSRDRSFPDLALPLARWRRARSDWLIADARSSEPGSWPRPSRAVLSPLAAAGSRRLPRGVLSLGTIFAFGPAAMGVAILAVLGPRRHGHERAGLSIRLRLGFGWLGVLHMTRSAKTGIACLRAGLPRPDLWTPRHRRAGVSGARARPPADPARRAPSPPGNSPASAAGMARNICFWFWPLLLCAYPESGRSFSPRVPRLRGRRRRHVRLLEYGLVDYLGAFLSWKGPSRDGPSRRASWAATMTLTNGPLFLAYVGLFAAAALELARRNGTGRGRRRTPECTPKKCGRSVIAAARAGSTGRPRRLLRYSRFFAAFRFRRASSFAPSSLAHFAWRIFMMASSRRARSASSPDDLGR